MFTVELKKGRNLTIPKEAADFIGVCEGEALSLTLRDSAMVLRPLRDKSPLFARAEWAMSAPYKLTLINESERFGDFCVYTTCPDARGLSFDIHSLAWLCKEAHPNTKVVFDWSLDYSFAWSETGELVPGVNFIASQILEANPSNPIKNRAFFDRQKNAYLFGPREEADAPKDGGLNISTSGNIPNGRASIGIGIGGKPALATNATMNYNFTFIPRIKYWVAFGTFEVGEVLDLNSMMRQVFEIDYRPNEFEKTVVLGKDNRWTTRAF